MNRSLRLLDLQTIRNLPGPEILFFGEAAVQDLDGITRNTELLCSHRGNRIEHLVQTQRVYRLKAATHSLRFKHLEDNI